VRKGSSIDFAEKPTEITKDNSSSVPDSEKTPEKSALKKMVLADGPMLESPKASPMQSTTELKGIDPEELQKTKASTM